MNRSQLVPAVRARLKAYANPHSNYFGVVPLPPTEAPVSLGSAAAIHNQALASIGAADRLAKTLASHFFLSRILPIQEAIASSAIEGTHSTLDNLLELETGEEEDEESTRDTAAHVVRNYALALERALPDVERNRYDAFSIGLIRDLQREVASGDPSHDYVPGRLRQHSRDIVYIGGGHISRSVYNPCPPEDVQKCLEEQVEYLRCTGLQHVNQSVIVRMAIGHAHFEAIHPFHDGNGRAGRLLLPLMMIADDFVPLYFAPYLAQNRSSYMDALRAAQQRLEYAPLVEVFSHAIVNTVDAVETAHDDLTKLHANWIGRRKWRKGSAALTAIDLLIGHPVVTASRLAKLLNVSNVAANSAIGQLTDHGILTERTGFRRNRVFVAGEVLSIYNRPVRGE